MAGADPIASTPSPLGKRRYRLDDRSYRIDSYEMIGDRLRIDVRPTRTGVQVYDQGDGTQRREQRDAEEVFKPSSLATFRAAPITVGHPSRSMVTAADWRDFTVGVAGENWGPTEDGIYTSGSFFILDGPTQKRIIDGELIEVSGGYFAGSDDTPGKNDAGEQYDARQIDIEIQHFALLPSGRARGGPGCRLRLDSKGDAYIEPAPAEPARNPAPSGRRDSMILKLMIGGSEQEVEFPDEVISAIGAAMADPVIAGIRAAMQAEEAPADAEPVEAEEAPADAEGEEPKAEKATMDALKAKLDAAKSRADKLQAKLDAFTPERLNVMAQARAELVAKADLVAGRKLDGAKLSDAALKLEALKAAKVETDGKSDAYIDARFDLEAESVSASLENLARSRAGNQQPAQKTGGKEMPYISIDATYRDGGK